jgi:hypothetical protein
MRLDCDFKMAEKCLDRVPLTLGSLRKEIALRMSSCRSGLAMAVEIQKRMSSTTSSLFGTPPPRADAKFFPDLHFFER